MHIDARTLILAATFGAALPQCEGCRPSKSVLERSPVLEIRWKGEDTGFRGRTVIHDDGVARHD